MATIKGVWKLNQDLTDTKGYGSYYPTWYQAIQLNGTIGGRPFTSVQLNTYGSGMNELVEQLKFVSTSPISINLPACEYKGKVRYGEVSQYLKNYLIDYGTVADGGVNEKYRYIDFGTEEQDLSDDVYRWFEGNAVQWLDEISTIETPTVNGVWIINDKPARPDENLVQAINFSSRNQQYKAISIDGLILYLYADSGEVHQVYDNVNWAHSDERVIDFGTDAQEVFHEFYAWLTANATPQASEDDTPNTLIIYDGVTVEMDGELPATLECEGKKARTDIIITPAFPIKIAYGGIVHTADEGTPATLVCSGKKMRADVVITAEITTNFILADGSMLVTSDGLIFETQ